MRMQENNKTLFLVAFAVLLTRIPFIFTGYGSEEDAWGLILVARNINLSGIYEVSRMPGHPVQEYLLSFLWKNPAWLLNFLTAIVSSAGVFFFMKALKALQFNLVIPAGITLAFVPVFFIHSTNVMDYTWALSLILVAFYLTVTGKYLVAGVIIGIACGFRITAGAMVIPFAIWHYMMHRSLKEVIISGALTLTMALLCFIPAFQIYGTSFFTYYEYFPYPPILKNIYKGTVGAWGIIGMLALLIAVIIWTKRWLIFPSPDRKKFLPIVILCCLTIAMYSYSFLRIPQKTAFVLPMVPFFILLLSMLLSKKEQVYFAVAMVLSCFFIGINLDDPLRGSKSSSLAIRTQISGTPVSVDLLSGPVIADYTKRIQKIEYAKMVTNKLENTNEKTVIIAGFWQNEMNYFSLSKKNNLVSFLYYANENDLRDSISSGNKIYFLPEQDYYNDLRFGKTFTNQLAQELK